MGILDEAIREHLELKRQHGAEETELKGLEDEAFGQAERPDATGSPASAEAETQIISPGSSVTTPAGEGDQLDKVFEATRQREADAEAKAKAESAAAVEEPAVEDPEASAEVTEVAEENTVDAPESAPVAEVAESAVPSSEGDDGNWLDAERQHLSSHPTEHYDVDAAIAEEDEIDVLSESSLSDELDRALESGEVAAAGDTVQYDVIAESDSGELAIDEPESAEPVDESTSGEYEVVEEDSAELLYQDAAPENQPVEEDEEVEGEVADSSSPFFDQDDVLEATPDFLEETPEHDQLWFEQKEPKDFDFGD